MRAPGYGCAALGEPDRPARVDLITTIASGRLAQASCRTASTERVSKTFVAGS